MDRKEEKDRSHKDRDRDRSDRDDRDKDRSYKDKDRSYEEREKPEPKKEFKKFEPLKKEGKPQEKMTSADPKMIEVVVNDRLGKKVRVKCCPDDTIGDLKKLLAAHTGTRPEKLRIQKSYNVYKDHITLKDYEINHGMGLELYYN